MKKIFLQVVSLVMLVFLSCGRGGQSVTHIEHLGDTPYQADTILVTYGSNPERALVLLDSAVKLGHVDEYNEKLIRATIFGKSLTERRLDSAQTILEGLLVHDSVVNNAANRESVLNLLINVSRAKADDNEYLHWSILKADLCRQRDQEVELLRTEAEIGLVMTHLGRLQEGLEKIDNSIRQLDKPGSIDRMDAFIIASKRKINVLNDLGRYAETIPLASHVLDRLAHYEQHASDYAEDSYRLSWSDNPTDRDNYIDFSRAQANGFLAIAYAMTGDAKAARSHLAAFDQSNYGKMFGARVMIIPAQMGLGLYDEAMNTCDKLVQRMGTDTINAVYATVLHHRAIAARANGRTAEAYDMMRRHALLYKEVSDSLHQSQAHDNAARYHAKEQQLKIQKAESESSQKTIVVVAIAVLLVVSTIAAFRFHRQNRLISKKNHALVRMINEAKQLALDNDIPEEDMSADDADEEPVQSLSAQSGPSTVTAAEFSSIDAIIRNERLYTNPNLQRRDICKRFDISRITINNMLSQYRGSASLPQYINSIRMEEAVRMLRENPEFTITSIAEKVGFSPANFRKHFIASFGMTPLEFRQNQ